jgi:hypothetical protein
LFSHDFFLVNLIRKQGLLGLTITAQLSRFKNKVYASDIAAAAKDKKKCGGVRVICLAVLLGNSSTSKCSFAGFRKKNGHRVQLLLSGDNFFL